MHLQKPCKQPACKTRSEHIKMLMVLNQLHSSVLQFTTSSPSCSSLPKVKSLALWLAPSFPPHHAPKFWLLMLTFSYFWWKQNCPVVCLVREGGLPYTCLLSRSTRGKILSEISTKYACTPGEMFGIPNRPPSISCWLLFSLFFTLISTFCLKWLCFF